ncbi:hypothetical protein EKO27_g982 [Xylaria grammica]|uniref:Uncharacterized protein n=1 Tax=Xylaria grammica TaxID=363999 RepID=A0A439DIB7_9PEZI|nr:hypothetical protein EKO27_g982 [Xylaria grammica]
MPYYARRARPRASRNPYLTLYYLFCLIEWIYLTVCALVYDDPGPRELLTYLDYITVLEGFAAIEIAYMSVQKYLNRNAYFDSARALKVGARNLIVWTIMQPFPGFLLGLGRRAFLGCVLAWSVAGTLRYLSFFLALTWRGAAPVLSLIQFVITRSLSLSVFAHRVICGGTRGVVGAVG